MFTMKINLKSYYLHTLDRVSFTFLAINGIMLLLFNCENSLHQYEVLKPTEYEMSIEYNVPNPSFLVKNQKIWIDVN